MTKSTKTELLMTDYENLPCKIVFIVEQLNYNSNTLQTVFFIYLFIFRLFDLFSTLTGFKWLK